MRISFPTLATIAVAFGFAVSHAVGSEPTVSPADTQDSSDPQSGGSNPVESNAIRVGDSNALRERVGMNTTVYGIIGDVGYHAESQITFLNFRGNTRGDFVCIIRGNDLQGVLDGLSILSAGELVGKTLETSGLITLHRDTPQIEIKSADQIRVVD